MHKSKVTPGKPRTKRISRPNATQNGQDFDFVERQYENQRTTRILELRVETLRGLIVLPHANVPVGW